MFVYAFFLVFFYTLLKSFYAFFKFGIYNFKIFSFFLNFNLIFFIFKIKKIFLFSLFINILIIFFINLDWSILQDNLFTTAYCMEEERVVSSFPIRNNININVSLNHNSRLNILDGLNQFVDDILVNPETSLLILSSSNRHLGIIPGKYDLPCTNITEEMLALTNKIIYVLNSAEYVGGLSRPHFLEFLQNFNNTIDFLKYFSAKSSYKINNFHCMNLYSGLNLTRNFLNTIGNFDFAMPLIAQFSFDFNIQEFNKTTIYFYTFLTSIEMSTQQAVIDLESNRNFNSVNLLNITSNSNVEPVNLNIILDRARFNGDYNFNRLNVQSITILTNNNFIVKDQ